MADFFKDMNVYVSKHYRWCLEPAMHEGYYFALQCAPLPMLITTNVRKRATMKTNSSLAGFTNSFQDEVDIPTKNHYSNKQVSSRPLGLLCSIRNKEDADKVIEEFNGKRFQGSEGLCEEGCSPSD